MTGVTQEAVFRALADFSRLRREGETATKTLGRLRAEAREAGAAMEYAEGRVRSEQAQIQKSARAAEDALHRAQVAQENAFGRRFQRNLAARASQMRSMGRSMTYGFTLPVVAAGVAAVHTFTQFDSQITAAGLKAGATKKELAEMRDVALEWGAKTTFSATETAGAMDNLAANGLRAKEVITALPGVTRAAQAANADLAETADVVSTAMNAFNIKADKSAHIADVLTQAANTSAIDLHGLGLAFGQVGEVGSRFGQNIEDVVAFVSRLVNLGVPAASAGASIRQGLTSLSAPTTKANEYMQALSINVRDAQGNMKALPDIIDELSGALNVTNPKLQANAKQAGLTAGAYRDYALKSMFGVEGAKAFGLAIGDTKPLMLDAKKDAREMASLQDGLAQTMGKKAAKAWIAARTEQGKFVAKGPDTVRALAAMNKGGDGIAKTFGKKFSKTAGAQIEQLQGSIQTFAIKGVKLLLPYLLAAVKYGIRFVDWLTEMADKHPTIAKWTAAFVLLGAVLGPVILFIGALVGAIAAIGGVGIFAIGVIIGIWTALVTLWRNSEKFQKFVKWLWGDLLPALWAGAVYFVTKMLVPAFVWLWKTGVMVFTALGEAVMWLWRNVLKPAFEWTSNFVMNDLIPTLVWLWKTGVKIFKAIAAVVTWWWREVLQPSLHAAWVILNGVVIPILKRLWKIGSWVFRAFGQVVKLWWDVMIKPRLKAFWWFIKNVIWPVLKWLWAKVVKPIFKSIGEFIVETWEDIIKPAFDALKKGIEKASDAFEVARKAIKIAWNKISGIVKKPIVIAIDIVNNGLIKPFNWLAEKLGSDAHIDEISTKFAGGGQVPGQRMSSRSDKVPAMLTADEHVIRQRSARRLRRKRPGLLEHLNRYGDLPGSFVRRKPKGRRYAGGGRVWPLPGSHAGTYAGHDGVDLNVGSGYDDNGLPFYSAAPGVVSYTGYGRGYGNAVFIRGSYGELVYGHSQDGSIVVSPGQVVGAGHMLGRVGMTGNASAPHLHFGFPGGTYEQAMAFLSGANVFGGGGNPLAGLGKAVMSFVSNPLDYLKGKISGGLDRLGGYGEMGKLAGAVPTKVASMMASAVDDMAGKVLGGALNTGKNLIEKGVKNSPLGLVGSALGVFDRGGLARGTGLLSKSTIDPERVLSPRQTIAFERLVSGLLGPGPSFARLAGAGSGSLAEFASQGGKVEQHFEWKIYNPEPEPASESSLKTLTKIAQEGFGG